MAAKYWVAVFFMMHAAAARAQSSPEPIRYTLHISEYAPTEAGHCTDGGDNDADGLADQQDPDCH